MSGSVIDAAAWWSQTVPDQTAIDFDGDVVSYAQLGEWVDGVAAWLQDNGVTAGDRVGLVGANSLEWCVAALATWKAGAIVCGFNQRFVAGDLRPLIELCVPTVVLADVTHLDRVKDIVSRSTPFAVLSLKEVADARTRAHSPMPRPVVSAEDPTLIVFTSGTTGTPKGVVYTHGTIAGVVYEWSLAERVEPNGLRPLLALPLFSAAGVVWGLARSMVHGGTLYLQQQFDPPRALEILQKARITTLNGPPIIFEQIAAVPGFDEVMLDHVTTAWVGGSRVTSSLLERWRAQGVALRQMYGQTETGGGATVMPAGGALEKCGSGGMFTRIRVVDESGDDCPPDVTGEIIVRGPGVFPGYWCNPEATARALRAGWLYTGDLGSLDEDGVLTFIDRVGEIINSGGLKISPIEVEALIQQIPGVAEVAVFAVADPKFGETPAAIVSGEAEVDPTEVVAFCNERLADFKVPRYVILHTGPLPRMASGKINKRDLRATYCDAPQRFPRVR
ncbi:long-chain fatty acid--CoA ligase [Rhodococcus opacus]|nr:long-chain fatty acid--CoA ligase [Rhodococcus opacus]